MGQTPVPLSKFTRTRSFASSGQETARVISTHFAKGWPEQRASSTQEQTWGSQPHQQGKRQASDAAGAKRHSALALPRPSRQI